MTIPGRILVVDNVESDVSALISDLMKKGENVLFTEPMFEHDDIFRNVRLVIFDYYLIEEDLDDSLNTISLFINSINKQTKFFLIAIWSGKITESNKNNIVEDIREKYKKNYTCEMPGIILPPFSKTKLSSTALIEKLLESISLNPDAEILYEMESILDKARDRVVSEVYEVGNWSSLVRNLEKVGLSLTSRHLIEIYINFIKRHFIATAKFNNCVQKIAQAECDINDKKFGIIFFMQNYYFVPETELIWTGDILVHKDTNVHVIVITPECDFAQNNYNSIKIIECERIGHKDLFSPETAQPIIKKYNLNSQKAAINAVFTERSQLRRNYFPLAYITENPGDDFFHLIADFEKTKYLPFAKLPSELEDYSRLCRVDSPLINKILQRYGSYCARIGAMAVPKELVTKLKEQCSNPP